jgi:hypothetical protein
LLFFLGASVIIFIEIAIRYLVPAYRRPLMGSFIMAGIVLAIGLGGFSCVLPLILILIGVSILLRSMRARPK